MHRSIMIENIPFSGNGDLKQSHRCCHFRKIYFQNSYMFEIEHSLHTSLVAIFSYGGVSPEHHR